MTITRTEYRTEYIVEEETRQIDHSRGCLSGFIIPPLIVLCFGLVLVLAAGNLKFSNGMIQSIAASTPQSTQVGTSTGTLAPLFTPEIQHWAPQIARWSAEYGVDPNIAATVMQIESCGNPDAQSSAGASGLFQVMPFHFAGNENAFDPDTNALRGLGYLQKSLQASGGDARLALAGYNGGIGVIPLAESNWAAETIRYVYWGSGIYTDALQNASKSSRLDEWLAAGGYSLCETARQRLGLTQ